MLKPLLHLLIIIVAILWLISCSTVNQTVDQSIFYKRDLYIEAKIVEGRGVLVVPLMESYNFKITSYGDMDYFVYKTCHRQVEYERVGKIHNFRYTPSVENQSGVLCPLELESYESGRGRHGWGFIVFEDRMHTLPATLNCNGNQSTFNGVSVCMAKEGLIQEISFDKDVKVAFKKRCEIDKTGPNKRFNLNLKKGICVYEFMEMASGKLHRLFTVGYERGLIRK